MPEIGPIGWIIVGFLAGALSGFVFKNRTARGCLPNILIGILGGLIGGYLSENVFHTTGPNTWFGALIVAFFGAVIIRFLIGMTERR
ncbi:MAG: hypothetical protein QOH61_1901 [Chloroflexota bacterium]|nr:hypothetical protein [Chloroflexota bacterium]